MALVSLYNDTLRCEIDPESGASITMLAMKPGGRWVPIMRPTPPEAIANRATSDMSCFVLLPYSNRIKDAEFRFEGESYKLQPNTPEGHTIHGDVRKRPWQVSESDPGCVRLRFESRTFPDINFPFPFNANLSYEIHESTFRVELELENSAPEECPRAWGSTPTTVEPCSTPMNTPKCRPGYPANMWGWFRPRPLHLSSPNMTSVRCERWKMSTSMPASPAGMASQPSAGRAPESKRNFRPNRRSGT